ncbi:hypothetical protein ROTAS13_02648 [Roseomonas sp. TAS13]|nr:hypothetical protein ROTAS13_02648 [Roseomonas sp. TAS13]
MPDSASKPASPPVLSSCLPEEIQGSAKSHLDGRRGAPRSTREAATGSPAATLGRQGPWVRAPRPAPSKRPWRGSFLLLYLDKPRSLQPSAPTAMIQVAGQPPIARSTSLSGQLANLRRRHGSPRGAWHSANPDQQGQGHGGHSSRPCAAVVHGWAQHPQRGGLARFARRGARRARRPRRHRGTGHSTLGAGLPGSGTAPRRSRTAGRRPPGSTPSRWPWRSRRSSRAPRFSKRPRGVMSSSSPTTGTPASRIGALPPALPSALHTQWGHTMCG